MAARSDVCWSPARTRTPRRSATAIAWVYRRFENDPALIAQEAEAKAAGRGLWRDPEPLPPWVWRERHPPKPAAQGALSPEAAITRQEERR